MSETSDYLKFIRPEGPWFLQALPPEGGPGPFVLAKTLGEAIEFRNTWNGKYNLYCRPNVTRPHTPGGKGPDGPGGRNSVEQVTVVMADVDPYKPGAEGMEEAVQRLNAYENPPSLTVMTGGGLQPYWKLESPTSYDVACGINQFFIEHLGGDKGTFTPERNMRLPGTINIPNKAKRALGRTEVEATILARTDRTYYDIDIPALPVKRKDEHEFQLDDITPVEDLKALPIGEALTYLITFGYDETHSLGDNRSDYFFKATCDLIRAGIPDDVIAGILLDVRYGISEHAYKHGTDQAHRAVERAIKHAYESGAERRTTPEEDFDTPDDGSTDAAISAMEAKSKEVRAKKEDAFAAKKAKYRRKKISELQNLPKPEWLIKDWITKGALGQVIGVRKKGKTFAMLDMCLHVALGREWNGHPTIRERVTYVIAEGSTPRFYDRVHAWCIENDVEPAELEEWFDVVDFRVGVDNAEDLKAFVEADESPVGLIVFDTVARNMDGDENSTADMNLFVKGADLIRNTYGCTVIVVHHIGKDETRGGRGSTSLPGAVDVTIVVRPPRGKKSGLVEVILDEVRDAERGEKLTFEMVKHIVDDEDDIRTSVALRFQSAGTEEATSDAESPVQQAAEDVLLCRMLKLGGALAKHADAVDPDVKGLSKSNIGNLLRKLAEAKLVSGTGPWSLTKRGEARAKALETPQEQGD